MGLYKLMMLKLHLRRETVLKQWDGYLQGILLKNQGIVPFAFFICAAFQILRFLGLTRSLYQIFMLSILPEILVLFINLPAKI